MQASMHPTPLIALMLPPLPTPPTEALTLPESMVHVMVTNVLADVLMKNLFAGVFHKFNMISAEPKIL